MSSDSDRDKDFNNSQPKPDNPFIKFRQFADTQIGSLLQGIVGLPSAFTKGSDNARWADFDEEMRRRDELQARQKELRESEGRKAEQQNYSGAGGWPHWLNEKSNKGADDEDMDDKKARDILLYSSVTKSLFSCLQAAKEDRWGGSIEWRPVPERGLQFAANLDPITRYQGASDLLKALRTTIYGDLNSNPILRSQYSLLPYLMFSPYSPIKLELDAQDNKLDQLPYREAFQDLMLCIQGRSMGSLTYGQFSAFGHTERPERAWIYQLWANGILQQSSTTNNPEAADFQTALNFDWQEEDSRRRKLSPLSLESDKDAKTEQDMYERFLRRASSSTGIAEVLESMFTDAEGWINKELAFLNPAELKRQMKEFTDFLEQKTGDEAEDEKRANAVKALESLFLQAVGILENPRSEHQGKRQVEKFRETSIGRELEDLKRKAAADPKSVFTSTTTEHTTNENGSVETSVTVWKRYADGRETTTTTSHIEEPACCDDEDEFHEQTGFPKVPEQKKEDKKDEKKGWFWN